MSDDLSTVVRLRVRRNEETQQPETRPFNAIRIRVRRRILVKTDAVKSSTAIQKR